MDQKKKVLIVGAGSYVGMSFYNASKDLFDISIVDSTKPLSVETFRGFDCVFHVAGIAHVSRKKKMKSLYYRVNRDLAIQSAQLAKEAGVMQFIFMSSMIIFGGDFRVGKKKIIDESTNPNPEDFYGDSKLQADLKIQQLSDEHFHTVVIRTPMVYGDGCKGNYPRLLKLAKKLLILPKIYNERTVIHIDTLISFLKTYIISNSSGVFYPRDSEPLCTYSLMLKTRKESGQKTISTRIFNPLIRFFSFFVLPFRKMFGTKIYSDDLPMI